MLTATFTNPERNLDGSPNGASANVIVRSFMPLKAAIGEISEVTMTIDNQVMGLYDLETTSANPVQLNSTVLLKDGSDILFDGVVWEKPIQRQGDNVLTVVCRGKEQGLAKSLVPDASGNYIWSQSSDAVAVPGTVLARVTDTTTDEEYQSWYPDPSETTLWYDTGVSDVSAAGFTDVATTIVLSGTYQGFTGEGFVVVGAEYIWYSGYSYNGTSSKWELLNCIRGALGTTAAAAAPGSTVTQYAAKEIAPGGYIVNWDDSGTPTPIDEATINPYLGKFIFIFASWPANTVTADYYVYDEDGSLGGTAIDLSDIVIDIITAPRAYGGAGFTAGDYTITSLGLIITRIDYSPKDLIPFAWELIQALLQRLSLSEEVIFYYHHGNQKFQLETVAQKGTPDIYCSNCVSVVKERSLEDCLSGILVQYSKEASSNVMKGACSARVNLSAPNYWLLLPQNQQVTGAGQAPQQIFENLSTSAGPHWQSDPGDVVIVACWFGPGAPTLNPNKITLTFDTWGQGAYKFSVMGATDLDPSDPFAATWQDVAPELTLVRGTAGGSVTSGANRTVEGTQFTVPAINGLAIKLYDVPLDNSGGGYRFYIREFKMQAGEQVYELVQLTDTLGGGNASLLEKPLSYRKLRGGIGASVGTPGVQNCDIMDIGASSQGAARSIAWLELLERIKLYESRTYTFDTWPVDVSGNRLKPELGMTARITETVGTTVDGIIQSYQIECDGGVIKFTLDILDYGAGEIQ